MNDQTLIENVDHYIERHTKALAALNAQQADRLSQGGDVLLDWSQIRNRMSAQARASIAADLRQVIERERADDPTAEDVHADALRRYVRRSMRWVRTPSSTDAVSNAMDALMNDHRLELAGDLGLFD